MTHSTIQSIIEWLSDPTLWIGVAIGIIPSIIANYATRLTDKLLEPISARRRAAIKIKRDALDKKVEKLLSSPSAFYELKLDILYNLLSEIIYGVFFVMSLVIVFIEKDKQSELDLIIVIFFVCTGIASTSFLLRHSFKEREKVQLEKAYRKKKEEMDLGRVSSSK